MGVGLAVLSAKFFELLVIVYISDFKWQDIQLTNHEGEERFIKQI